MTRIDCVRCLKDSNVVIKLLVKHNSPSSAAEDETDTGDGTTSTVKADRKKLPRPPPVPPRKISRKPKENTVPPRNFADEKSDTTEKVLDGDKHRFAPSSPRTMLRSKDPPRIRDRRLSDGSSGPPDAEVYLDLLSQELDYGLRAESESDDTGSTISTVVDRQYSSSISERCSIASDSIPSTPTLKQKQLDLTKVINPFEILEMEFEANNNNVQSDEYLINKVASAREVYSDSPVTINKEIPKEIQSPANFQDAHLSYGNENVQTIIEPQENNSYNDIWEEDVKIKDINENNRYETPPKPTPRKCYAKKTKNDDVEKPVLPRLVNFVPKTPTKDVDNDLDQKIKVELQKEMEQINEEHGEIFEAPPFEEGNSYLSLDIVSYEKITDFREADGANEEEDMEKDIDGEKYFVFKWSSSGQLATIGEDEELESSETQPTR